jgi:hypothetical protein
LDKHTDSRVQASVGLVLTTVLFALLLRGEKNRISLTEGEQHWRKQVLTFFACLLHLLLAGAGTGLAIALGSNMKIFDSTALVAPLIWASIQAFVPHFSHPVRKAILL